MNISISKEAQDKLQGILTKSSFEQPAVRIFFAGFGWGGPELGLTLDESKDSKDTSFYQNKIKFLMDGRLKQIISDDIPLAIDFNKSIFGEGFIAKYGSTNCHD